eukprot:TRINITY_DN5852_c0_g1_i1.p1 TRINITY_DN5852_c0_g1~~TRINITY_DN5852_c0_g1_i1.p1  ORF type:complete len:415 (+),score=11.18 TRINITY_DN5852_c0_g1_i1:66-1310(+)
MTAYRGCTRCVLIFVALLFSKALSVVLREASLLQSDKPAVDSRPFTKKASGTLHGYNCYTAPLNALGYSKINKQRSDAEMECFARRLANSLGKHVKNERYFSDVLIPHHSGRKATRGFVSLMKTLKSASWVGRTPSQKRTRVCIVTPTALDFDKYRILDWIAYHKLLGVDCFILILDPSKQDLSDRTVSSVRHELMRSSMVTVLEAGPFDLSLRNHALVRFPADAKYLVAMDVDEYLVPNRRGLRPCNGSVDATLMIPRLLKEHCQGSFGLYVNRYNYGPNGWKRRPPYEKFPELTFFDTRADHHHRNGKYIVDVEEVLRHNLSFSKSGPMSAHWVDVPPNAVSMKEPDDSILSVNHYVSASVEECMLKASAGSHLRDRAHDCTDGAHAIVDKVLAGWSECTRHERNRLFRHLD